MSECELSKQGRRMLKAPDGMDPGDLLILEMVKRMRRVDIDDLGVMACELATRYGSVEAALTAVKSGLVTFTRCD
jgi:hypothetical protein